jgi:hypothetical protein
MSPIRGDTKFVGKREGFSHGSKAVTGKGKPL